MIGSTRGAALLLLVVASATSDLAAQAVGPSAGSADAFTPELASSRRIGPVRLDGIPDEEAWRAAPVFTDFVQRDPEQGAPSTERTEVRIVHDDDALYIAAWLYDSEPGSIRSQLARRDNAGASDFFQVNLDPNHDHLTAYLFRITPSGSVIDSFADGPQNIDSSWDPVWEAATNVSAEGWSLEVRIPFSQLRFEAGADQWGLQLIRGIHRKAEYSFFRMIPRTEPSGVDRYGHLSGMASVARPLRVELMPYVLGKSEELNFPDNDPFHDPVDPSVAAGLDAKIGLNGQLTLDATINPDFGQVEQDPAVVNLTVFEDFFPERRPFFVEGADAFRFGTAGAGLNQVSENILYSRRIGGSPSTGVSAPGARFVDAPDQSTIAGAAKVSGRLGRSWRIGLLDAVTTREDARYLDTNGAVAKVAVEPATNHVAARLRGEFDGGNTTVGAITTSVDRWFPNPELETRLHGSARTLGVDFSRTWDRRTWFANGFVAASRVTGSPDALLRTQMSSAHYFQRPDLETDLFDPTRTSMSGYSTALGIGRTGGRHWLGSVLLRAKSPGWEINDVGFDTRSDQRGASALLTWRETEPGRVFRSYQIDLTGESFWNYDGDRTGSQVALGSIMQFSDFSSGSLRVFHDLESIDDKLTRGGPLGVRPARWTVTTSYGTDPRRSWQGNLSVSRQWDAAGARQTSVNGFLNLRPRASLQLSVQPGVSVRKAPAQFLGVIPDPAFSPTFGRRYLFGAIEQTTATVTTRLDWTFTPRLSLQLYAQPLIGSGRFTAFRELAGAGVWDFLDYGADAGSIETNADGSVRLDPDGPGAGPDAVVLSPDFNIRTLRGSAVLRWEYRPGSTLFLVWQQRRFDQGAVGTFELDRDLDALFGADPQNVFVLKATWWIG